MAVAEVSAYFVWLTFIFPFAGALVMPLLGRLKRARDVIAVLFSLLSAISALTLLIPVLEGQTVSLVGPTSIPWISELQITMGILSDPYTIIISNVVAWVGFLIMLYSLDYMKGDSGLTRYWFFMNFFIGNMQLLVLSDNLLALFIGWEGVGLCSYALIGHYYRDEKENWVGTPGEKVWGEEQAYPPSHAGMKAFVMTRIGDVAMLAGILILFIYSGTFNYLQLAQSPGWATKLASSGLLVPVALLIFGGAVGKSAQFPLQEWLPDAMAGPAPVSALIHAATMVKAGVVLIARIGPIFFFVLAADPALIQPFFVTVAWIGAFTAVLAATQALVGFELKKILAYSTVSQVGYMIMALGLTGLSVNFAQGLSAALFHLISHAIFKACLFLAAGYLIHASHSKYINEMGGLRDRLMITTAVVLIAVASLSGIPPLSGFWSKDAILATAWDSGQFGLFLMGAFVAGLTAFYSFRMFGIAFFGSKSAHLQELEGEGHHIHEANPLSWIPYSVLAAGTAVIGLVALVGQVVPALDVEASLQAVSNKFLLYLFPTASLSAASAAFNLPAAGVTLLLVAAGAGAAITLYITRTTSPSRFVGETGFMHSLYKFFENRWYLNAIYYKIFVNAPIRIANWTALHVELDFLDRINGGGAQLGIDFSVAGNFIDKKIIDGVANGIAAIGKALSRAARRVQTGIVEQYALSLALGLLIILVFFILTIVVHA